MARFCTNCGKTIPDGSAFCTECGTPIPSEAPARAVEEPAPAAAAVPEAAVPEEAAPEEIIASVQTEEAPTPEPKPVSEPIPEPIPEPPVQPQPQPSYQQQQSYRPQPAPVSTEGVKPKGGKYGVVGTGAFFGLQLLFALPLIGWIACIIMAFAPKNENIRHYARANLIWFIVGIVLCVLLFVVFWLLSGQMLDYFNQATGGSFASWEDILKGVGNAA